MDDDDDFTELAERIGTEVSIYRECPECGDIIVVNPQTYDKPKTECDPGMCPYWMPVCTCRSDFILYDEDELENVPIQIVNAVKVMAKKFARHQTIHSSLKKQVDHLREVPGVSRVIIGPSRGIRHNRPVGSIKVQSISFADIAGQARSNVPTGIRILGYSDRGISEFYVITSDVTGVRCRIVEQFER